MCFCAVLFGVVRFWVVVFGRVGFRRFVGAVRFIAGSRRGTRRLTDLKGVGSPSLS